MTRLTTNDARVELFGGATAQVSGSGVELSRTSPGRDASLTVMSSLVGRFPLAVHREDGHTDWHTVLAFGPRAEQLQRRLASGELTQGREVNVVGYRHVDTRPGRDGKLRQVQEVYAVTVKKR